MTYIASVRAKNGVAIIADSLVTSSKRIINDSDFSKFLQAKQKTTKGNKIDITAEEIAGLFKRVPSHTSDYENKLIRYDPHTALTTSGRAFINDKKIEDLISEIINKNNNNRGYARKKIKTKVKDLCEFLTKEVKEHIEKYKLIYRTTFILTHFDNKAKKSIIYRISINSSTKDDLNKADHKYLDCQEEKFKIICNGQSAITEGILFGDLPTIFEIVPKITEKIFKDFKINKGKIPKKYIDNLRNDDSITSKSVVDGMKMFKLKELSLQQAVDLAWLLMNIEIAFQKYTENIPTVGGVIKLAVIDSKGFRFIMGDEIIRPAILT
jgi:hypothetical protein